MHTYPVSSTPLITSFSVYLWRYSHHRQHVFFPPHSSIYFHRLHVRSNIIISTTLIKFQEIAKKEAPVKMRVFSPQKAECTCGRAVKVSKNSPYICCAQFRHSNTLWKFVSFVISVDDMVTKQTTTRRKGEEDICKKWSKKLCSRLKNGDSGDLDQRSCKTTRSFWCLSKQNWPGRVAERPKCYPDITSDTVAAPP